VLCNLKGQLRLCVLSQIRVAVLRAMIFRSVAAMVALALPTTAKNWNLHVLHHCHTHCHTRRVDGCGCAFFRLFCGLLP